MRQTLVREIYKELVEKTPPTRSATTRLRPERWRLRAGGFADADLQIIVPPGAPRKGNPMAGLRGTGPKKPLLLLAQSLYGGQSSCTAWSRSWAAGARRLPGAGAAVVACSGLDRPTE
jgi:hypothetical protein